MWYLLETWKKIAVICGLVLALAAAGCGAWLIATGTEINFSDFVALFNDGQSAEADEDERGSRSTEIVVEDDSEPVFVTSMTDINTIVTVDPESVPSTGSPVEPNVTVTVEGRVLVADKDYILSWDNNVLPGTASVTVTGTGGYEGKFFRNFEIVDAASSASSSTPAVPADTEQGSTEESAPADTASESSPASSTSSTKKKKSKKSSSSKSGSSSSAGSGSGSGSGSSSSSGSGSSSSSSSSSRSHSSSGSKSSGGSSKSSSSSGMRKQKNGEL